MINSLWRRYQYVEIRNMPDWLVLAAVIPKLLGAKTILYMHENMPILIAMDRDLPADHRLVRTLLVVERLCASVADCLIAPHEMARRNLISQGIPREKIVVVPNVPDEQVFLAQTSHRALAFSSLRSDGTPRDGAHGGHKAEETGFHLVTHGSLLKRYGIQTLLEAMAMVRGRIPGLHLEIIGEGEYRAQLEAQARRLDLGGCVAFSGWVPFDQVAPRLLRADVGIVPMWEDFVPNKLMEYLALGLPTIATDSPALRVYFDDGALCYVERKNPRALADAILDLYLNPDRRFSLAARGRSVFRERLTWERTRAAYLSVYERTDPSSVDSDVIPS
jgi:glycosyltransferase involved in cell wall biosynthesis